MSRDCIADIHSSSRWASSVRSPRRSSRAEAIRSSSRRRSSARCSGPPTDGTHLAVAHRARRGQPHDQALPYARHHVVERRPGQGRPRPSACASPATVADAPVATSAIASASVVDAGAARQPRVLGAMPALARDASAPRPTAHSRRRSASARRASGAAGTRRPRRSGARLVRPGRAGCERLAAEQRRLARRRSRASRRRSAISVAH